MEKNRNKKKLVSTIILVLTLTFAIALMAPAANAQVPRRKTTAYLTVNPPIIGQGQPLTVNLWILPSPATRDFSWYAEGFNGITITFTKPDGSIDNFMPTSGSPGLDAGVTEMIGAIWFLYYPNQVGTWTVKFSMPEQTIGTGDEAIIYEAASSQSITFTVQQAAVQIGLPPVDLPGPNDYWESPINSDNREWYQISGAWLQNQYNGKRNCFNPYSTAPNTGHILWTRQVSIGGLIGGDWGGISYGDAGGTPPIIMMGRVYYTMPGGVFQCVDLRTGELIYEAPGSLTFAKNLRAATRDPTRGTPETEAADVTPSLWHLGSTQWKLYNPLTGALTQTITNVDRPAAHSFGSSGTFSVVSSDGDPVFYIVRQSGWNTTIPNRLAESELIKWDYSMVTGNDWMTGIVWRVSLKQPDGSGPGEGARGSSVYVSADTTVGVVSTTGQDDIYAYDLTTGAQLWTKKLDFLQMGWYPAGTEGTWYAFDSATRILHYFDIKSGNELWSTQIGEYPWGSFINNPRAVAYDTLYVGTPDGYIYALDVANGNIRWKFFCGSTTETVFHNWMTYHDAVVADGKLYSGTSEHTPTQPRIRGNKLYCIDAFTGEQIWNISGAIETKAVAEGYVLGPCENDGLMYCIGKGKTETTVEAPLTAVPKGTGIVIRGTVMDMSPAQPGTPAIADEDMSAWMNYMHMQQLEPKTSAIGDSWGTPVDVSGVSVKLTAIDPNGNTQDIGTVTSDMTGLFKKMWTPPVEGEYTIIAQFDGSGSYWPSYSETALGVGPAQSPAALLEPEEPSAFITTEIAIVAAVSVVAVIGVTAYWILRKRK